MCMKKQHENGRFLKLSFADVKQRPVKHNFMSRWLILDDQCGIYTTPNSIKITVSVICQLAYNQYIFTILTYRIYMCMNWDLVKRGSENKGAYKLYM